MYHYYQPLQQLLTHIYSDTAVNIGCIEPNHLSTLHHTPERQERIHTHITFKFTVSYISHIENPKFIATEEFLTNDHKKCFISIVAAVVWIATYNHCMNSHLQPYNQFPSIIESTSKHLLQIKCVSLKK